MGGFGRGLAVALAGLVLVGGFVRSDSASVAALMPPRESASAAFVGGAAFVFGGYSNEVEDTILRYAPATREVTTIGARLPHPTYGSTAVALGARAYVFGGAGYEAGAKILRYDPGTDTLATMAAQLPGRPWAASAAGNGSQAYLFGGRDGTTGDFLDQVLRYDTTADRVERMSARFATPRADTSAAWVAGKAYIFGGKWSDPATGEERWTDDIVRYDPAADTLAVVAHLPNARAATAAAAVGDHVYVLGGSRCEPSACRIFDEIVRYSPATNKVVTMSASLPSGRNAFPAVSSGTHVLTFGGCCFDLVREPHEEVVAYDLSPSLPPTGLSAGSPTYGQVYVPVGYSVQPLQVRAGPRLTWEAPPETTYHPPLTYRIYRGASPDALAIVGETQDTQYIDSRANPTLRTYYRVDARNDFGATPPTATVCWRIVECSNPIELPPVP